MCVPTTSNSFSLTYPFAITNPTNVWCEQVIPAQQENQSDPIACLETNLEKQLEKNHEYRERSNAMKSQLDTLRKVQFFSREGLHGELLFRCQTGEELRVKRGKFFLLKQGSVFVIDKEVFLTQEAKQSLLKASKDFLLDRGRILLSQMEEIFLSEGEFSLIEKGKSVLLHKEEVFSLKDFFLPKEVSSPEPEEIFLSEQGEIFLGRKGDIFFRGEGDVLLEQGEIFFERQGEIFQSTTEILFSPDRDMFFRSNKVKGFLSEERADSLAGATKKMLINFLIKEISLIEENAKNDKQIKSLEEQLEKFNSKNQNKDQIAERILKEMIRGCKEENDRYQTWNNNWFSVQEFLELPSPSNPKQLLGKLARDNGDLQIAREKKMEMIKSLEKQLEQVTQKDILSKAGISPCS